MFRSNFEHLDRTYVENNITNLAYTGIGEGRNVTETEIRAANDFWAEEFRKAAEEALKES